MMKTGTNSYVFFLFFCIPSGSCLLCFAFLPSAMYTCSEPLLDFRKTGFPGSIEWVKNVFLNQPKGHTKVGNGQ